MDNLIDAALRNSGIIIPCVAILGIIVAIFLFRLNGKRNRVAKEKEVVTKLLKLIHNNKVGFNFGNWAPSSSGGGGGGGRMMELTLFEVADMYKQDGHFTEQFDDYEVLFSKGINQILELKEFVSHPILPPKVSKAISKFHNIRMVEMSYKSIKKEVHFVKITSGIFEPTRFTKKKDNSDLKRGDATSYRTFLAFKESSQNLLKTLNDWNRQSNAGLNIRNDLNVYNS